MGELACCCCKMGTCTALCAQHVPEWSSHTCHGTTSHRHHSKSRIHRMHSYLHKRHTKSPRAPLPHPHRLRLPLPPDLHHHPLPWDAALLLMACWSEVLVPSASKNHKHQKTIILEKQLKQKKKKAQILMSRITRLPITTNYEFGLFLWTFTSADLEWSIS